MQWLVDFTNYINNSPAQAAVWVALLAVAVALAGIVVGAYVSEIKSGVRTLVKDWVLSGAGWRAWRSRALVEAKARVAVEFHARLPIQIVLGEGRQRVGIILQVRNESDLDVILDRLSFTLWVNGPLVKMSDLHRTTIPRRGGKRPVVLWENLNQELVRQAFPPDGRPPVFLKDVSLSDFQARWVTERGSFDMSVPPQDLTIERVIVD